MSCKIIYLRAPNGHPVGCVAMSYDRANRVVSYQASFLNPRDKFDRYVARNIAVGRLATKARQAEIVGYSHLLSSDITTHDITKVVMIEISSMMDGVPSRAVKAAKLWLSNNS